MIKDPYKAPLSVPWRLLLALPLLTFSIMGAGVVQPDAIEAVIEFGSIDMKLVEQPSSAVDVAQDTNFGHQLSGLGDFNEDGQLDVAITSGDLLSISLGDGKGAFQFHAPSLQFYEETSTASEQGTTTIAPPQDKVVLPFSALIADLNGDGRLYFTEGPSMSFAEGQKVTNLLLIDLNHDGQSDGVDAKLQNRPPQVQVDAPLQPVSGIPQVTFSAQDPDGDTISSCTVQSHTVHQAQAYQAASGSFAYLPNADAVCSNGQPYFETFTAACTDAFGAEGSGQAAVQLFCPAQLADASIEVPEDSAQNFISISISNLGAVDESNLQYDATAPGKGTLHCDKNNCTYTPNPNANGRDGFLFRVRDARTGKSDESAVQITISLLENRHGVASITVSAQDRAGVTAQDMFTVVVLPVPDPPQLKLPPNQIPPIELEEDDAPQTIDLLNYVEDPDVETDGDSLDFEVTNLNTTCLRMPSRERSTWNTWCLKPDVRR